MAPSWFPVRLPGWLNGALLTAGLLAARPAFALDEPTEAAFQRLEERFASQLRTLSGVSDSLSQRSAFMNAGEAERRYEEAVVAALLGYDEQAALEFSILLRSQALTSEELRADAEWYLAETLFKMSSWNTAETAYLDIVAQGRTQPFFAGSVRRLLELYGLTGETERFYDLYNRYVATGIVSATDLIQYTVARSFFRQRDWARAKSLFAECCPEEPLASRARYFLGTILVIQGDLTGALPHFRAVAALSAEDPETRDLVDLANLAMGRIRYEQGDWAAATAAYSKVGRESKYFADQLYEIVWTYIKQGTYDEALRAVEVFVLAFPDHRYTAQMMVLRGHLHMKRQHYLAASNAYEKVVEEYSPIRDVVVSVVASREQPRVFFERLAQEDALEALDKAGLPPFAAEMLYGREDLHRVVQLRRDLGADRRELDTLEATVSEIDTALSSKVGSLGAFRHTYELVRWIRNDVDAIAADLLVLEARWMADHMEPAARSEVEALAVEARAKADEAAIADRKAMADADHLSTQEAQVRAVQQLGFQVELSARSLLSDIDALERDLGRAHERLSDEAYVQVRRRLEDLRSQVRHILQEVRPIQGETVLRSLMALAERGRKPQESAPRGIRRDVRAIRLRLARYRDRVTEPGARDLFTRTDALWQDIDRLGSRTDEVERDLADVERSEIARVRAMFADQRHVAGDLRQSLDQALVEVDQLGLEATRRGFADLAAFFDSSVVRADMGIVDVYWIRKTQLADRIESLNNQRVDLAKETNKRFEAINARLEE
ncbi:MAG: hypothetical protein JXB39_10620 [Deltaproteobacteria bacterium]|nr:hypothetical protein [Deltaproteobacteria bacterium]